MPERESLPGADALVVDQAAANARQIDRLRPALSETTNDLERTADALADLLYAARFVCPAYTVGKATEALNAARDRVERNRRDYRGVEAPPVPDPRQAPAGAPPEAADQEAPG
jgi:hypothetical protein